LYSFYSFINLKIIYFNENSIHVLSIHVLFESSSTPARKNHSKERIARTPAVIERTQALISEDSA